MNILFITLICFILSLFLTYIVRRWAISRAILDLPNERSSHTVPTPRGGGLSFVFVWFIFLIYAYFSKIVEPNLFFALLAGLLLVIIGFIDDIISLKPSVRVIFQLLTCAVALFFLKGLALIDLGIATIGVSLWLNLFVLLGMVWMVNLYNFLDGIDGYAATEAVIVFGVFGLLLGDTLAWVMVAAVLGFLVWNWQPAKIFMGDAGSTLLGFNIAVFAIYYQNSQQMSIITLLILTALFWFDATITLYRRWRNKEQLSIAHRKHAYQRLTQSGWSHQKVVLCSVGVNLVGFIIILLIRRYTYLAIPALLGYSLLLYVIVKMIDKRKTFK